MRIQSLGLVSCERFCCQVRDLQYAEPLQISTADMAKVLSKRKLSIPAMPPIKICNGSACWRSRNEQSAK